MPVVNKGFIEFSAQGVRQHLSYEIEYLSGVGFFILIPEKYIQNLDYLTEAQKAEYHVEHVRVKIKKYAHSPLAVITENEQRLRYIFLQLITLLSNISIKSRPVILVWFKALEIDRFDTPTRYEYQWQPRGCTLGLKYCLEQELDGKKVMVTESKRSTGEVIGYSSISMPGNPSEWPVVLDDTPENRAFLEDLHRKLVALSTKLSELTGTQEQLLEFIQSNVKLLS